jgi:hypothetical protein
MVGCPGWTAFAAVHPGTSRTSVLAVDPRGQVLVAPAGRRRADEAGARAPAGDDRREIEVLQRGDLATDGHVAVATVVEPDHLDPDLDHLDGGRHERCRNAIAGEVRVHDHEPEIVEQVQENRDVHHPGEPGVPELQQVLGLRVDVGRGRLVVGTSRHEPGDQPEQLRTGFEVLMSHLGSCCHHDTSGAHGTPSSHTGKGRAGLHGYSPRMDRKDEKRTSSQSIIGV